jgi:hypothetical protein
MEKNCPKCGKRGLAVGIETLKSLLRLSLRLLNDALIYRFCATSACDVVYFASDGSIFSVNDINVPVYQKAPDNPTVLLCYCFQHRLRDFLAENAKNLLNDIQAGVEAGQCACELRNPQGNCCLGNVRALLKESQG